MRLILCIGWILVCCCMSGCATMFTDRTQKVTFKTEPSGAKVTAGFANNRKSCITPCTMDMDRNGDHILVSVSKKGYTTEDIPLMPRIEPLIFANILNFGVGGIVDMINGRLMRFDPEQVITLTPQSESVAATSSSRQLVERVLTRQVKPEEVNPPSVQESAKAAANEPVRSTVSLTVIANSAKLRKTPDKRAAVIKTLRKGDTVSCIKQREEWFMVELPGGEVGWCHKSLLSQK